MTMATVDGVPVARIEGEIDISNAQELGDALLDSVSNASPGLVVDLSGVRYLDSAGVHLLLRVAGQLRMRRQELRAVAPADAPLRSVLGLTAADRTVPLHERADDAVAAIGQD